MTAIQETTRHHLNITADPDAGGLFEPLPRSFRFTDTNPITGTAYATSPFAELPPFALREVPVTGVIWDHLVDAGQVARVLDPFRRVGLDDVHDAAAFRAGLAPISGACPDCWGTLISLDTDGSCTGTVGVAMWCGCFEPHTVGLGRLV